MPTKKNIGKRAVQEIGPDMKKRAVSADGAPVYRKAIYLDEAGEGVYHFELQLGDRTLYCRELDTNAYDATQKPIAQRYKAAAVKSESKDAKTKAEGTVEMIRLVSEIDRQQLSIIGECVIGWDAGIPYSPDVWKRLTKDARENLIGELIGKSTLAEDENFTNPSS